MEQTKLFEYVKELVGRVEKLENENIQLRDILMNSDKSALSFTDRIPTITFHEWIDSLDIVKGLRVVFDTGLVDGINKLLEKGMILMENDNRVLPIHCFKRKPNTFYIYDDGKWIQLSILQLDKWIEYIAQKFLAEFKNWCETNELLLSTNEQAKEAYFVYFQNVLGGKRIDDIRNSKVRQFIYNKVRK
jgi:hypothetical protein